MKLFLPATIALVLSATVSAQQDPTSTLFHNTFVHINPATAGLEYRHAAHVQYHSQWDFNSGANSLRANYAAKINKFHSALGGSYMFVTSPYYEQQEALAHYAFHIPVKNSVLSIGVSGGAVHFLRAHNWVPSTVTDDPAPPANSGNAIFTMNSGVAFHTPKWNAGFSVSHLNAPVFRLSDTSSYSVPRQFYVFADYQFTLSENWSLRPRLLVMADALKSYGQLAVMAGYKKGWFGVHCRTTDGFGISAGIDFFDKLRIGYAFERANSELSGVSLISHELTLGFLLE